MIIVKVKIYSNRLVNTTTSSATTLKKYNYNYSGALTSITVTNTSDYSVKIKSQWKYNSSSFLREYTEFDTTGFGLNDNCQSIFGLPISVSALGSTWRYKYSMFGTREQKRLLYSPSGDSCSKQLGWVYYMQGAGGDTRTIYKGKQTAKDTIDSGRRVYFWADKYISAGGLSISPDSTKEIEIKDALGSVRALAVVTKDLNSTITTTDYKPFGDSLRTNGTLPDDAFIGMELDGERSQYHFNARSYDPKLSRFFAPDLLFDMFPNQSPYSYSNNSPLNFKDPSGMLIDGYRTPSQVIDGLYAAYEASYNDPYNMWLNGRMGNVEGARNGIGGGGGGGGNAYALDNIPSHVPRGSASDVFSKIFNTSELTGEEFNNLYKAFSEIYSSTHGKEMINYIADKLDGNKITLIGANTSKFTSMEYPRALGLTCPPESRNAINGSLTMYINTDFELSGANMGLYEKAGIKNIYYDDPNEQRGVNYFSLIYSFAHELAHVYDMLSMADYGSWDRDTRENSANNRAFKCLGQSFYYEYLNFQKLHQKK